MISYTSLRVALICSWCSKTLRNGTLPASHTCCTECVLKYFPELETM